LHVKRRERRRHRRLRLRLPVRLACGKGSGKPPQERVTNNVSAGGMYLQVPRGRAPACQTEVVFEMHVPPGAGYSASAGKIKGAGRVVRSEPLRQGAVGLAVQFTNRLALEF
jgi:c-di-GMP-binding flagellar brake protein YcgR